MLRKFDAIGDSEFVATQLKICSLREFEEIITGAKKDQVYVLCSFSEAPCPPRRGPLSNLEFNCCAIWRHRRFRIWCFVIGCFKIRRTIKSFYFWVYNHLDLITHTEFRARVKTESDRRMHQSIVFPSIVLRKSRSEKTLSFIEGFSGSFSSLSLFCAEINEISLPFFDEIYTAQR